MFDDFELLCLDEAEQKGCDVDYQINGIDNYRINPRTSKEQYRVEWAPINGKKFRKTWANATVVDAPALTNKVKRLQNKAMAEHDSFLPRSFRRPYANNRYVLE